MQNFHFPRFKRRIIIKKYEIQMYKPKAGKGSSLFMFLRWIIIFRYIILILIFLSRAKFAMLLAIDIEPKDYKEAIYHQCYNYAMNS
jgi:hypothetical protein